MARIRSIKPEFWTDEKVVKLSPLARLLFIGLWNFADDEGRMVYSPSRIKMQVLPSDSADISELLGEIRRKKLVVVYTESRQIPPTFSDFDSLEDETVYLQVVKFDKHQKIDKRTKSKLPSIPTAPAEFPRIPTTDQGREGDQGGDLSLPATGNTSQVTNAAGHGDFEDVPQ